MTKKELVERLKIVEMENDQLKRKLNVGVQLTYNRFYQLEAVEERIKTIHSEQTNLQDLCKKQFEIISNLSSAMLKIDKD